MIQLRQMVFNINPRSSHSGSSTTISTSQGRTFASQSSKTASKKMARVKEHLKNVENILEKKHQQIQEKNKQ